VNTTAVSPARRSAAPTRSNYAWVILIACLGFYAVPVGIVGNTSGIFVTPVMEQFGWSRTEATLYMTIQPWVAALCTPFAGKLMAKYNPRWILTITAAAYGLSTIWTAYATHPWQWHLYGVIYGVSCSFFMFLAVPTLVNAWFRKQTGLAIGIAGAALSIFAAIASPVGQSMIESQGWQHTRLVFGIIITVVSVVFSALFVRKDPASMNVLPFGADDAEVAAMIQHVVDTALAHGKIPAVHCTDLQMVRDWRGRGARMLTTGLDTTIVREAMAAHYRAAVED